MIEKYTWRTHRYFVNFESWIDVELFTSNRCHSLHVDLPFLVHEISTDCQCGFSLSNQQRIDEDVSIGLIVYSFRYLRKDWKSSILEPLSVEWKYIRGSNSALLKSKFEENSFVNNWHKYNKLAINWLIYLKQNVFRMNTSFWQYIFLIKSKPEDFNRNNWLYFIS